MEGEIILWAAVIGLLLGIIWSLRYVVRLERKYGELDTKIEGMLSKRVRKASKPKKKK
tara:strand:+ start:89 stop:262 length:174 start_codon:yes stop_codon:yes gene_type:complete